MKSNFDNENKQSWMDLILFETLFSGALLSDGKVIDFSVIHSETLHHTAFTIILVSLSE